MDQINQHYSRIHYTLGEAEYNRFVDAGWRYIHFDSRADGDDVTTSMIIGWPEEKGEPIYPRDPSIKFD